MKSFLLSLAILLLPSAAFATVPSSWTCPASYYTDSWCDCGCGAYDPACSNPSASLWKNCSGVYQTCMAGESTCHSAGVRAYRRGAFGGETLEHTYPCRVESSTQVASYCDLPNVWGECYSESEYCPESWRGDGWCDPGCENVHGVGGDLGDCDYSHDKLYCKGVNSSGVDSNDVGGDRVGNSLYAFDTFFYYKKGVSLSSLQQKFNNVVNEVGQCEFVYGIDGTCHQHTNRGFFFHKHYIDDDWNPFNDTCDCGCGGDEDDVPQIAWFDVAGSTLSSAYPRLGIASGFHDCIIQEGINFY